MLFRYLKFTIINNRGSDTTNLTEFALANAGPSLVNMSALLSSYTSDVNPIDGQPLSNLFDGTLSYTSWLGNNVIITMTSGSVLDSADYPWYAIYLNNGAILTSYAKETNPKVFKLELSNDGTNWTQCGSADIEIESLSNGSYTYFALEPVYVCVHRDTIIEMSNGDMRPIATLKVGDEVKGILRTHSVHRIITSECDKCILIPPGSIAMNTQPLIISDTHPIWINGNIRAYAWNIPDSIAIDGLVTVYNLQFLEEGTFYANGALIDSLSPNHQYHGIGSELVLHENDSKRRKPLLQLLTKLGTKDLFTPKYSHINYGLRYKPLNPINTMLQVGQ